MMKAKAKPTKPAKPIVTHQEWDLSRLDARTAQGIPPTAVKTPDGFYVDVNSAEDAYFASIGRSDLCSR